MPSWKTSMTLSTLSSFFPRLYPWFGSSPRVRGAAATTPSLGASGYVQERPLLISLVVPRARGDATFKSFRSARSFQSTPHVQGATAGTERRDVLPQISIPAPRTRGDVLDGDGARPSANFNPFPSCEGRPYQCASEVASEAFQSAPLV